MTDTRQYSHETRGISAHQVVRQLAWRYLFVLASVAALMVVDQAIIQPMLVRVNTFAPAINVAGRQRMLSQKLTKTSLALRDAASDEERGLRRNELGESLAQWTVEHKALLEGDSQLGIRPIRTGALQAEWAKLEPHYEAMVTAATALSKNGDMPDDAAVASIVEHERQYLPTMDRIVKLMEGEAARAVMRLRAFALGITAAVLFLLLGLGWFVVRPATRTIRDQVDGLETRVAQRTQELSEALASLQHEIHERELAEVKNQRISAELAHAERVTTMGHLTAGLAHELNQPLAAIANYTEACDVLLDRGNAETSSPRVREFVVQARRAALRAGQIVRRMRNFVRPNAASASDVSLNDLVQEIVELCRTESANAGAEVKVNLAATDVIVAADPIQVQQVLVNLVQNALQAMRENADQPREVVMRTSIDGEFAQVTVWDTGPGFTSLDSEIVFAPFHTTKQEGLGIGLSICRSIVEGHGGKIWAESRPERGAQVSFTLPLANLHADRLRNRTDCVCC